MNNLKGILYWLHRMHLVLLAGMVFLMFAACALQSAPTPTPIASLAPTPTATPTPTLVPTVWDPIIQIRRAPECLQVLSTGYIAEKGRSPKLIGEVINNCSSSFSNVTVTVLLMKSLVNLQVDAEERGIGSLQPGEKGSFGASWRLRYRSDPQPRASDGAWDTVILGIQGVGQSQAPPDVAGLVAEVNEDGSVVVANNTDRVIGSLRIFRTGYNAEGRVVASDFTNPLGEDLRPSQTMIFHLNPSSNPSFGSTTFNYYVGIDEPVTWTVRVSGAFRD